MWTPTCPSSTRAGCWKRRWTGPPAPRGVLCARSPMTVEDSVTGTPGADADGHGGVYGLRLTGVDGARHLLVAGDERWPRLRLVSSVQTSEPVSEEVTDARATLNLKTGGHLTIDRRRAIARYVVPRRLTDEELIHPYLAPAAAVMAHWLGGSASTPALSSRAEERGLSQGIAKREELAPCLAGAARACRAQRRHHGHRGRAGLRRPTVDRPPSGDGRPVRRRTRARCGRRSSKMASRVARGRKLVAVPRVDLPLLGGCSGGRATRPGRTPRVHVSATHASGEPGRSSRPPPAGCATCLGAAPSSRLGLPGRGGRAAARAHGSVLSHACRRDAHRVQRADSHGGRKRRPLRA